MANKIKHPFNSIFSWYIKKRIHQIDLFRKYPTEVQHETLFKLLGKAQQTEFGLKYDFSSIEHKEKALPFFPARAVRPILCT